MAELAVDGWYFDKTNNSIVLNGVITSAPDSWAYLRLEWGEEYAIHTSWQAVAVDPDAWPMGSIHQGLINLTPDTLYNWRVAGTLDFIDFVYYEDSFQTNVSAGGVAITDEIKYMAESWVLSSILINPGELSLYCGVQSWTKDVQWWEEEGEPEMNINWHNPPEGATTINYDCALQINIGGLSLGKTYYWRAVAKDGEDNWFYGSIKSFTMPPEPPPPIYDVLSGNSYLAAKTALENMAGVAGGNAYIDREGNLVYRSRN